MRNVRKFPITTSANIFKSLDDQITPNPTVTNGQEILKSIKISEENSPLTPLSERLDMNLGETYITTETNSVLAPIKFPTIWSFPDFHIFYIS